MNRIRTAVAALVLLPALALAQGAQPSEAGAKPAAQGTQPPPASAGKPAGKDAQPPATSAPRSGEKGATEARPAEKGTAAAKPGEKGTATAKPGEKGAGGSAEGSAAAKAAAPPSAAQDLARALTTKESWNGILDGYASSLAGQISGALAATGKEAPADLTKKVRGDLEDAVRYEQAIEMQARALSGRFAEDELRTLERFYRSGPGKKLLEALPEIAQQVNDELRARLSERVPRIVQRYAPSVAAGSAGSGADEGAGGEKGAGGKAPKGRDTPPVRESTPAKPPAADAKPGGR